jgi:hypothetical protein
MASPEQCCDVADAPGIDEFNSFDLYPDEIMIGHRKWARIGSNIFSANILKLAMCPGVGMFEIPLRFADSDRVTSAKSKCSDNFIF